MAITIFDNFQGQKNKPLDNRIVQDTKADAIEMLKKVGVNGLIITVLYRDVTLESGAITQVLNPQVFSCYYDKDLAEWVLQEVGKEPEPSVYTNLTPTEEDFGHVKAGSTFENADLQFMMDAFLHPERFPDIDPPTASVNLNGINSLVEVGSVITGSISATFNKGKIQLPNTSEFLPRSGDATQYRFSGPGLSTGSTTNQNLINYTFSIPETIRHNCTISYGEGPQPLSNKGNDYDSPLPAGSITSSNTSVTAVYPIFASTTASGLQKLPLTTSKTIEVTLYSEGTGGRQAISFPPNTVVNKIELYNTLGNKWESGNLSEFEKTNEERIINGINCNYVKYIHSDMTTSYGERIIRFYI